MKVQEYLKEDGSSPYAEWFDSLDPSAAAKVTTAKLRMERGLVSAINGSMALENTKLIGAQDTVFTWLRPNNSLWRRNQKTAICRRRTSEAIAR
jgi:hypothetical protein